MMNLTVLHTHFADYRFDLTDAIPSIVQHQYLQQITFDRMKSLVNDLRVHGSSEEVGEPTSQKQLMSTCQKSLLTIAEYNRQCESAITAVRQEIGVLEEENIKLDSEIQHKQMQLKELHNQMQDEQQKSEHEEQQDMNDWIQKLQQYSGLTPQAIDSLLVMDYEGSPNEQEICLSCYEEMKQGAQCKYLPCSHIFHKDCIDNHLKANKACPACGEEVIIV